MRHWTKGKINKPGIYELRGDDDPDEKEIIEVFIGYSSRQSIDWDSLKNMSPRQQNKYLQQFESELLVQNPDGSCTSLENWDWYTEYRRIGKNGN